MMKTWILDFFAAGNGYIWLAAACVIAAGAAHAVALRAEAKLAKAQQALAKAQAQQALGNPWRHRAPRVSRRA